MPQPLLRRTARRTASVRCSGCQAFSSPYAARFLCIPKAIVQTTRTALPELELLGHDAVTAPPRRARYALAVFLPRDGEARLERVAALNHLALARSIHAPAALDRARREVRIGFFATHLLGTAVDAHLTLE